LTISLAASSPPTTPRGAIKKLLRLPCVQKGLIQPVIGSSNFTDEIAT